MFEHNFAPDRLLIVGVFAQASQEVGEILLNYKGFFVSHESELVIIQSQDFGFYCGSAYMLKQSKLQRETNRDVFIS